MIRPYTCVIYNAIFDKEGNIRNPLHTFLIRVLLSIMRHYLNIPCQPDALNRRPKIDDICTGRGVPCFDPFSSGRRGKARARARETRGQKCEGGNGLGDDFSDALNEFLDETDLSDQFGGNDNDFSEKEKKKKQRRESFDYGDEIEDEKPVFTYTLHKRKKPVVKVEEIVETKVKPNKKKAPPKKKTIGKEERRYMGQLLPVLMHEPFNRNKPSTWVRRHPQQIRILQNNEIGTSQVHRYKRATLERQMKSVSNRYSVHSIYETQLEETPMFGHGNVKKRHRGMAKLYDYKKLRDANPQVENEHESKAKKS